MDVTQLLENFLSWFVPSFFQFIIGMVILLIGWKLINRFSQMLLHVMRKRAIEETLVVFLEAILTVAFRAILILIVMGIVGLDTASLAALFASAGLAIGLAMQGSLSNFAGGVIILFLRPFKVGDYISDNTHRGTVEAIKIFYTQLVTLDNKVVYIPNGSLANGSITNYTQKPVRRLEFVFGISYQSDIAKAKAVIADVLQQHPDTLTDPQPFIGVSEHAASSVNLIVWVWCETEKYWPTHYDIVEGVKLAFDAQAIEIPYPQLDLHIKNTD